MGWGEPTPSTPSPSQRLTARAHLERKADELADAVDDYLTNQTTGRAEVLADAVAQYRQAR